MPIFWFLPFSSLHFTHFFFLPPLRCLPFPLVVGSPIGGRQNLSSIYRSSFSTALPHQSIRLCPSFYSVHSFLWAHSDCRFLFFLMNSVILPSVDLCALVPHSTRPVWHNWNRSAEENGDKPKPTTARRRLFQEDLAEEETNEQFVQRLLNELTERYKCKWGFDFETERPLENAASRFEFQAVSADSVPGFYRASNFVSSLNCSPNNSDTENHENQHHVFTGEQTEEAVATMMEKEEFGAPKDHSPRNKKSVLKGGAFLRKVQQKSIQTPKRRRSDFVQTRVTDFLSARKHLSFCNAAKKDGICDDLIDVDSLSNCSPHSRRRRSLFAFSGEMPTPKKSIVRQRRYEAVGSSSVSSALFK